MWIVLRDEAIDVALHVGNVLQRHFDSTLPRALLHLVGIARTAAAPADGLPFALWRHRHGLASKLLDQCLQMPDAVGAQRRGDDGDQAVILAKAVVLQRIENLPRQRLGRRTRRLGHLAQIGAGLVEDVDDGAAAVIAAFEHGRRQSHEPPQKRQRLAGMMRGDLFHDGAALGLKIFHQRLAVLPVHKGPRFCDAGQPLGDLPRRLPRALRSGKGQTQLALGRSIASADLDQQLRQTFGAQRLQGLCIEGGLRRHVDSAAFRRP